MTTNKEARERIAAAKRKAKAEGRSWYAKGPPLPAEQYRGQVCGAEVAACLSAEALQRVLDSPAGKRPAVNELLLSRYGEAGNAEYNAGVVEGFWQAVTG